MAMPLVKIASPAGIPMFAPNGHSVYPIDSFYCACPLPPRFDDRPRLAACESYRRDRYGIAADIQEDRFGRNARYQLRNGSVNRWWPLSPIVVTERRRPSLRIVIMPE